MEFERPYVSCDYQGCIERAVVKRKYTGNNPLFTTDKKKNNNLCVEHYHLQNEEECLKWNDENDLTTVQQRKDYFFNNPLSIKRL
jgi:hypothetical protein